MSAPDISHLRQPPFDSLSPSQRDYLHQHSNIVYLDNLQQIPRDWQGDFFIILKGQLHQLQEQALIANLSAGDWFDTNHRDTVHFRFITQQQSLLYRINGKALHEITEHNPTLKNSLFADLALRLDHYQTRLAKSESQKLLYQPIANLGEHIKAPHFVTDTTTLYEATVTMNRFNIKHILVQSQTRMRDAERDKLLAQGVDKAFIPEFVERIGIFTQTDVCHAIEQQANFMTTPVLNYTNFRLTTVYERQDVSDALLTMLQTRTHRLPVIDAQGKIIGILGQTELLSFLSNHSNLISARIEQAHTFDEVAVSVELIGKFIRQQHQSGVKIQVISQMVQSLNLQVFNKVWQLIVPALTYHNTCLLVMGSEGRGEQIMRTDQDNALIIRNGFKDENLPQYAKTFNDTLASMGYPYCEGNIMINNERWRKTLTAFEQQTSAWFASGTAQDMIWIATLIDAYVVCGDSKLFEQLKKHWQITMQNGAISNFTNRFAKPILQFGDSSRWWQKFSSGTDSDIDLKKAGIFPIVHGVRALSLDNHIEVTNTKARLQQLEEKKIVDKKMAQNLTEALEFFMAKRLDVALNTQDRTARKVNPNQLSALEKDLLKECLAIVKDFKSFITHHYRLDIF